MNKITHLTRLYNKQYSAT